MYAYSGRLSTLNNITAFPALQTFLQLKMIFFEKNLRFFLFLCLKSAIYAFFQALFCAQRAA